MRTRSSICTHPTFFFFLLFFICRRLLVPFIIVHILSGQKIIHLVKNKKETLSTDTLTKPSTEDRGYWVWVQYPDIHTQGSYCTHHGQGSKRNIIVGNTHIMNDKYSKSATQPPLPGTGQMMKGTWKGGRRATWSQTYNTYCDETYTRHVFLHQSIY